jgi:hypothetical protein
MATTSEALAAALDPRSASEAFLGQFPMASEAAPDRRTAGSSEVLRPWINMQAVNLARHAAALRPFRKDEFGTSASAPTPGHIEAVNALLSGLRRKLLKKSKIVRTLARQACDAPSTEALQTVVNRKDQAHRWVQAIEKIWDFYFELFGQRQSRYANWLLSCDRIALDCYRTAYLGLGVARSIPAPPPFCYMRTGFSPATFRRGILLRRLGRSPNPFPLVELPYHRLVNPWTLGAVLHEISHNLQSDLGLSKDVPRQVALRLLKAGLGREVAMQWARWNREMFADMSALLLGGPEIAGSLMDVVGRGVGLVGAYNPGGVHPTPYLRLPITAELLRRMGFTKDAELYQSAWKRIYPKSAAGNIPDVILRTFPKACALAVDAMCYRPYRTLGNRSLAEVIPFGEKETNMIDEAAGRLAAGNDPGIIPERFTIGAARVALRRGLAKPGVITHNFYKALASG